jgi:hypothetical protein
MSILLFEEKTVDHKCDGCENSHDHNGYQKKEEQVDQRSSYTFHLLTSSRLVPTVYLVGTAENGDLCGLLVSIEAGA